MDQKVTFLIIALIAALLFFLAVGYGSWPGCGTESILGSYCGQLERNKVTGALLLTAGLLAVLGAVLIICWLLLEEEWMYVVAAVMIAAASILAIAGVFYYLSDTNTWSPFIATIGMALIVALAAIMIFDLISEYY